MDRTPLADALRACHRHFLASALFSGLVNILYIAPTIYMLQIYDRVVPGQSLSTLLFLTLTLMVALLASAALDGIRTRLLVRAGVRLDHDIAPRLLDAAVGRPDLPVAHHALRDFDLLRQTLTGPGALALFDVPWTPVYLLVCFLVHPLIGALSLFAMAVLPFIAWLNERATRTRLERAQASALASYVWQEAVLAGAETVRALGMRRAMVSRQLRHRRLALRLQTEAGFAAGGYVSGSRFARQALQSLALGLGALLAVKGQISAGAIFASSFLIGRAVAPVELVIASWRSLVQARASARDLSELLAGHSAGRPTTDHRPPRGALTLEGITVMNEGRDRALLQGVSFACRPGEMIAIVGPSGAGKSTLARVIAGARQPDRGTLRFDEIDSRHLDPERLGRHLGYLPQDSRLFPGTIKDNICRFADEGDVARSRDEAAIAAAELVGAHALIARLPQGYDQPIGMGGGGVSAGQAQRIALARAVYGGPALLVLDEPNAHLDAEGDHGLNASLARLKEAGTTVLIVSHKLSMLPVVDTLLLLREGKVEMVGPRDEVLSRIAAPGTRRVSSPAAAP